MSDKRTILSLVRSLACVFGLLFSVACACPQLVESYDTPRDTLALWQAQLCRDDEQGEYACLAASFQRTMHGFATYHNARAALLRDDPFAAWVLQRADLQDAIVESGFGPDANSAWIVLGDGDRRMTVLFEREPYVTVRWSDGSSQTRRQALPIEALFEWHDDRTWFGFPRPPVPDNRLRELRAIILEPRWKISDLGGLATGTTGNSPAVTP